MQRELRGGEGAMTELLAARTGEGSGMFSTWSYLFRRRKGREEEARGARLGGRNRDISTSSNMCVSLQTEL